MAELLLQRTRAQQAEKQFIIYMKKYPTFSKLQKAKKSGLSKIFRPLGLEKRVNTVTTLVKVINKNYNGDIPKKYEDLMKLPGVGDYIANAVMIFALNRPGWLVDVNIIKVFSDLFGLNISREEGKKSKFIKECSKYFTSLGNPRKSNWNLLDYAMKNGG
jgi:A/G-specific adenine glycosylase